MEFNHDWSKAANLVSYLTNLDQMASLMAHGSVVE